MKNFYFRRDEEVGNKETRELFICRGDRKGNLAPDVQTVGSAT